VLILHGQIAEVNGSEATAQMVTVRSVHFSRKIPEWGKKLFLGEELTAEPVLKGPAAISDLCQTADNSARML
jgi:hypothetical protein